MNYRKFGSTNQDISILGLGTMRLPVVQDGEESVIDKPEAIKLIRYCIDNGINYVDTAYPYHNETSETVVGEALRDGYRQKVALATKLPCWMIESPNDFNVFLDKQLEKLQTDHVDFYLLHALFSDRWAKMKNMDILAQAERAMLDGRIKNMGFSFHGDATLFCEIIDSFDWKMCQIQYNYVNENVQAGTSGLMYAAKKGVPVVIMEPLLGGTLSNPPESMKQLFERENKSPTELAFKWLWNKKEVSCVLSGMSSLEQARQNITFASNALQNGLTTNENEIIQNARKMYEKYYVVPCTRCGYCQPCPSGVKIPNIFEIYNESQVEGKHESGKAMYNWHTQDADKANNCIGCKLCETQCPQHIPISELMKKIHNELVIQ